MSDLADGNLIRSEIFHNKTQYFITESGKNTLKVLRDKITDSIEADTTAYIAENKTKMRLANSLFSDYHKSPENDYIVHCALADQGKSRIDLTITVPKQRQAKAICENWEKQNETVYTYLMDLLMR